MRRQIPLELVFQDISTFDAGISTFDLIVSSLLQELDVGKKDTASDLIKKSPTAARYWFYHTEKAKQAKEQQK